VAKGQMPDLIFVGPVGEGKQKLRYKQVVFQILQKNPNGTPLTCRLIQDKQTVHLEGGEEFMTAYIPQIMLEKKK